jgi:superfamily II DNA or RNA helicase
MDAGQWTSTNQSGTILTTEDATSRGLFHPKVGILKDRTGNVVSFSGSVNESGSGWMENIEEFKVFRSWESSELDYLNADLARFDRFWEGSPSRVKIIDIPTAVRQKLIEVAPTDIENIDLSRWYHGVEDSGIRLFEHQEEAVRAWLDNRMLGIFEMATGVGKTFAAFGCLTRALESSQRLLAIIACPQQHLVQQWQGEIGKFGIVHEKLIIADGTNRLWRNQLADALMDMSLGYKKRVLVLTTHRTLSSNDFGRITESNRHTTPIFLIVDEVHGIGAEKARKALSEHYELRLGLSATPKRWFDLVGTSAIYDYFGDVVYEFGLDKALRRINPATGHTYLTPYRYIPWFARLTTDELEEYADRTRAIVSYYHSESDDEKKAQALERLLFQRADITKNAAEKYGVLNDLLEQMGPSLRWTIAYCSPQQIDEVMAMVNAHGVIAHRFTMKEGTTPESRYHGLSEREFILEKFAEGAYQILVAMRCLDEGVDVPPARTAILMASSGNPREYIQRIGRVIRRFQDKAEATIHDIIVAPAFDYLLPEMRELEIGIFEKEMLRCEEIARNALNSAEALHSLYQIKARLRR